MNNFIVILTYLVIGIGLRRIRKFPAETANVLNLYVIYVCLPALALLKIPELEFSSQLLMPVIMPWFMLAVSAGFVLLASSICKWDKGVTGALMLLIPMGNTSFLGIPMVRTFLGEAGVPYAVLYDQLGSFLALSTYGTFIIAFYSGSGTTTIVCEGKISLKDVATRIITFPPFIALLLAIFIFKNTGYPNVATTILTSLAATLVPVVMIAVGFQLKLRLSSDVWQPLGIGLAIKLIIAPLIALAVCRGLGFDNLAARVSVFEAGMPPMISAGALAILAELSPPLTAALVGLGIIVSFITLPVLNALL